MAITVQEQTPNRWVLRVSGVLQKADLESVQTSFRLSVSHISKITIMVVLDTFTGWQHGADWGDLSFYLARGNEIVRVAIVGDPKWEGQALMFAGAGLRRAPVKYFPAGQEQEARAWLG